MVSGYNKGPNSATFLDAVFTRLWVEIVVPIDKL